MSGGTRSYEMARRLVDMGHEVHMLTSWRDGGRGGDWFMSNEDGITVHWYPVPYSNSLSDIGRIFAFFKFLMAATRRGLSLPADLVFATSTPLTIAIPAYFISKKLSVPMVFEVRDLWPTLPIAIGSLNNPFLRWVAHRLESFAYLNSSQIVALSEGMKTGVVSTGYPACKVTVIPNSCDLDLFDIEDKVQVSNDFRRLNDIPIDATLIVYAGTFGRINGVSYLVDLAKSMENVPGVIFLAIGEGAEFNNVAELSANLGVLGKNFHMLGAVSKLEMVDVLCAADIATSLFIPLKEMEANSANKFFDALAAGLPVLINYGGWQADLLISNEAGLQLDRDAKKASEQIKWLLSGPKSLVSLGLNSRRLGESKFSRDELAQHLENVLTLSANESHGHF